MLNTAVGDVNHAVGTELKQPQLGRAQPAPDGQPRTEAKPGSATGNHRNLGQTVGARQLIERAARGRGDAALTEPRAGRARWAVRA
ncbi:MAG: hypothetical protein ACLQO1_22555 [Steroidobacteraceae bacterium]